jgi:molybdopterin-guanine dinucleotide biosynthesis protein MobB
VKVIPVAGFSGSGKTTFIRTLVPLLSRHGPVATVKHTGHHSMELPEGKDTTVMFGAGARAVAGIDPEKTIITLGGTSLADALDILAGQGIAIAVVEGYKESALPKIAIGDVMVERCVLRNPEPEEVLLSLDRFPDYTTIGEILRELGGEGERMKRATAIAASSLLLPREKEGEALSRLERDLPALVRSGEALPGVIRVRAAIHRGSLFGKSDELLVAAAAESGEEAAAALQLAIFRCREILDTPGAAFR